MTVPVPDGLPRRVAIAFAAGAGDHAQVAWEVLDPDWAELRRRVLHGEALGPIGDSRGWSSVQRRRYCAHVVDDPHHISDTATGPSIAAWRRRLAELGELAPTPRAPSTARRRPGRAVVRWWVRSATLRRHAAAVAGEDNPLRSLAAADVTLDAVNLRHHARWAVALAEQPRILHAVATAGGYPIVSAGPVAPGLPGAGWQQPDYHPADAVAAVAAAVLVRHGGADALRVGLGLIDTGPWGLAELCDAASELTCAGTPR